MPLNGVNALKPSPARRLDADTHQLATDRNMRRPSMCLLIPAAPKSIRPDHG